MYTHQVNYEQVFVSGMLEGKRYTNGYIRFCSLEDAKAFADKEGEILECCNGTGSYRLEYPQIINLKDFD